MEQPPFRPPGPSLDVPFRPERRPPERPPSGRSRIAWLALSATLLGGTVVPGCLADGGAPGEEGEEVRELAQGLAGGVNIAAGKTATQSTTAHGGVASRAVDGDTNGDFGQGSVTHTAAEMSPWWQVDLGSARVVGAVELHNRTDCCADRLSHFVITVSDDGVSWQSWVHPGAAGASVSFAIGRTARYVKVQLVPIGSPRPLSLAEVRVLAPPSLAQGKAATQSTTGHGGVASRAVDGNDDGDFGQGSVTHTVAELSPWWQVDLGATELVGAVELHNRTDCCSDRLSNFKVLVSNDGSSWQAWSHAGAAPPVTTFGIHRTARYVKVQLESTGVPRPLSLAEVRVLPGSSPSIPGSGALVLGATAPAGTVEGELDVDAQGAATYSIPIQVPPGTNGVEPKLTLAYRSAGGNGFVGMGWGLAGLSTITRCARSLAQDGVRGAVSGDSNDRFCLDGKRLVVVSGQYGADGAEYRTELESFSRVRSFGTCGIGPCRFEVTDKSGNIAHFGGTAAARAMMGATVRVWGVSKMVSRHGNYLTVGYTTDGGQLYPQQILYTMNDAVPSLKNRRVAFSYEDRTDKEMRYLAGQKIVTGQRLTSVKTYVAGPTGDVLVRDYRLAYLPSPATGRSLLDNVKECDGQGVCLPPTKLDYLHAPSEQYTIVEPPGLVYQDKLRHDPGAILLPGDFNGDGKTDFLRQERGGWGSDISDNLSVYFSNGDGTFTVVPASCPSGNDNPCQTLMSAEFGAVLHPADINGDGLTDFYRQERGGWGGTAGSDVEAYLSKGDGEFDRYSVSQTGLSFDGGGPDDPGTYLHLGDFTGDGTTGFVGQARGFFGPFGWVTPHLALMEWNGSSFSQSAPPVVVDGWDWFGATMAHSRGAFLFPGDYNGDGLTDLLRQEHGEWGNDSQHNLHVYFAKGAGQFTQVVAQSSPANGVDPIQHDMRYDPGAFLFPGDFNGDGMTDFLRVEHGGWASDDAHTFQVYFSTGTGAFERVEPSGDDYQSFLKGGDVQITMLDHNGDGKTDFLARREMASGTNFRLYISLGDGTFRRSTPAADSPQGGDWYQHHLRRDRANVLPGDFDGDGKTDFLRQEKGGADDDTSNTFQVFFADGADATDCLKKVTNGLGGTIEVEYSPLTNSAVYTRGTEAAGSVADHQSAMYVVSSYTATSAADQAFTYSYKYEGARVDRHGRGFLGFSKVTRTDGASKSATVIEYDQSGFPRTGAMLSRTVKSTESAAQVHTKYVYSNSNTHPGVHLLLLTKEEVTHTELTRVEGTNIWLPSSFKTRKEYKYDAWGNLTLLRDEGLVDDPADNVDTCTSYSGAASVWWLDFPTYSRVASSCEVGADGLCYCTGVLSWVDRYYDWTKMNVTAVYRLDDRYGRWPDVLLSYDAVGNVASRSVPGNPERIVETNLYDPDYQTFLVAQTKSSGGMSFTTTSTFDPRFGTLVSQTDVNGNVTATRLDGLGRVVEKRETTPGGAVEAIGKVLWGTDAQKGTYRELQTRETWEPATWRVRREYLDGSGRLRQLVTPNDLGEQLFTDRVHDAAGQIAKESQPYASPASRVWQTYERDWLGRVVKTVDALGIETRMQYSVDTAACSPCGMKVVTVEALGSPVERRWTRHNDVHDKARRQVDPDNRVTAFVYDRLGRRTKVSDFVGDTTTVYDSLDRVTSVTSPDRGALIHEYAPSHWLSSTTDANGAVTTYTYDALGRVIVKTAVGEETTTFSYDDPARANSRGRLTSVEVVPDGETTPSSRNDFSYDRSGAVATQVVTIGGEPFTLSSTYDPEGRLRTLTYPDGSVLERSYAASGALRELKIGNTVYAAYDQFTELGKAGRVTYGNDVWSTFSYDAAGRMTATLTKKGSAPKKLLEYAYTWSNLHQIHEVADGVHPARSQTFTYTKSGELKSAYSQLYGTLDYEYDEAGNMKKKDGATYQYSKHRVVGGPGLTASYDAAGNRISQVVAGVPTTYEYGAENRLREVTKDGRVVARYRYDFTGERVDKVDRTWVDADEDQVVDPGEIQETRTLYVTPAFEVTILPDGRRIETKYLNGPSGRVAAVSEELEPEASAMLDFRGLDSTSRLYDTGSFAGLLAYVAARVSALRVHPRAPLWGEVALALALAAAGLALVRRRAPERLAAVLRALRAVALPEKTRFVRRHPVFAFVVPFVTAAFLSACTHVPGQGMLGQAEENLVAGANGAGYPVEGTHYFHQDHLGSSSLITGESGAVVARAMYKPYGEMVDVGPAASGEEDLDVFRAKFAGKEWDKDAGLYYFNARYYDPLTGRFLTADTQVLGGDERNTAAVNPYAYANNSPIIYSDPSGKLFFLIVIVAIVVGAYAGGMSANGGSWNPASWNWSSWQTYAGIGVGGLVGGFSAGVGVGIGGFAGAMTSTLMNSLALNGLKFLSPGGSNLKDFGISLGTDLAVGGVMAGASAAVASQVSKATGPVARSITERISAKIAERVTASGVATLLGKTALGMSAGAAMRISSERGLTRAMVGSFTGESWGPNKGAPPEPPASVDHSHVSELLTTMSDALLGATGADDTFGRSSRDFGSRGRRPAIAPSFAMGF